MAVQGTYGRGQMLGAGVDPRMFVQDYSGFANAGIMQGQSMANIGEAIGKGVANFQEQKKQQKEIERKIQKSDSVAKAIADLIPELAPTIKDARDRLLDLNIPQNERLAEAEAIEDILKFGVEEVRGRQERAFMEKELDMRYAPKPADPLAPVGAPFSVTLQSGGKTVEVDHVRLNDGSIVPLYEWQQRQQGGGAQYEDPALIELPQSMLEEGSQTTNQGDAWDASGRAIDGGTGVLPAEGEIQTSDAVGDGISSLIGKTGVRVVDEKPKAQWEQNVRAGNLLGQRNAESGEFKPYPGQTGGRIMRINPDTNEVEILEGKAAEDALAKAPTMKVESGQTIVQDPSSPTGTRVQDIPGGAAEAEKLAKQEGKRQLSELTARAAESYVRLKEVGGTIDPSNSTLDNITARLAATEPGQFVAGAAGTQAQQFRDEINALRPSLVNAIRQATGMSAKAMDSDRELQFYLQTVSDPTKLLVSNLKALDIIDQRYGSGKAVREMLKDNPKLYAQVVNTKLEYKPENDAGAPVLDEDVENILKEAGL